MQAEGTLIRDYQEHKRTLLAQEVLEFESYCRQRIQMAEEKYDVQFLEYAAATGRKAVDWRNHTSPARSAGSPSPRKGKKSSPRFTPPPPSHPPPPLESRRNHAHHVLMSPDHITSSPSGHGRSAASSSSRSPPRNSPPRHLGTSHSHIRDYGLSSLPLADAILLLSDGTNLTYDEKTDTFRPSPPSMWLGFPSMAALTGGKVGSMALIVTLGIGTTWLINWRKFR